MKTKQTSLATWSQESDGIVRFDYELSKQYTFFVSHDNMRDVLRDIGRMAANPACEITWQDAEYLTSLIREVMVQQLVEDERCECNLCTFRDLNDVIWALVMAVCCAAFWVALIVFVVWGAR